MDLGIDVEEKNRIYQKRDISDEAQSCWIFQIFQLSMNARIQATGIVAAIFSVVSIFFYTVVVEVLTN